MGPGVLGCRGGDGWGLICFPPLLPSSLLKSYLEFLWAAGMDRDDLPFVQGLSPQSCRGRQPKAHRQTATWIWVKDEIVVFESQPEEAARAVQMFPLSFWQRQHQEGKSRGGRRLPGNRGQRAELLPSRESSRSPLATPGLQHPVGHRDPASPSAMLARSPGWLF